VQLWAEGIEQFVRTLDWRAADTTARATRLMRELLVDYVARYRKSGAAALMKYADWWARSSLDCNTRWVPDRAPRRPHKLSLTNPELLEPPRY
jgi:hypothetical protein